MPSQMIMLPCVAPMFIEHSSRYGIFAEAKAALERYHHEKNVFGFRCGRDLGRFRSFGRLYFSAHLSRSSRLSVLVRLYRCPRWRAGRPLLLAYRALLG